MGTLRGVVAVVVNMLRGILIVMMVGLGVEFGEFVFELGFAEVGFSFPVHFYELSFLEAL